MPGGDHLDGVAQRGDLGLAVALRPVTLVDASEDAGGEAVEAGAESPELELAA